MQPCIKEEFPTARLRYESTLTRSITAAAADCLFAVWSQAITSMVTIENRSVSIGPTRASVITATVTTGVTDSGTAHLTS